MSEKTKIALSDALGIPYEAPPQKKEIVVVSEKISVPDSVSANQMAGLTQDAIADYNLSRETLRNLIKKGNDAMDGMEDIAKQSESPRAYEVMATLIKTIAETTKDLYDIQKKTKDLSGVTGAKDIVDTGTNITVDKAVFVGTSSELLAQVKKEKKE
jgi:hypothetical protein